MLKVEPTGQHCRRNWPKWVCNQALRLLSMPLQKRSPGGCTIDRPHRADINGGISHRLGLVFIKWWQILQRRNF